MTAAHPKEDSQTTKEGVTLNQTESSGDEAIGDREGNDENEDGQGS